MCTLSCLTKTKEKERNRDGKMEVSTSQFFFTEGITATKLAHYFIQPNFFTMYILTTTITSVTQIKFFVNIASRSVNRFYFRLWKL